MSTVISLEKPQPKQELFLKDTHKHVAFGGARGGGKSWSLRFKAKVMCLKYPGIKIGIVRTTYPELTKNHIEPLRTELCGRNGIAKYNDSKKEMTFSNGSKIYFLYCNNDNDTFKFSGIELDILMLDEATHFRKEWIDKMRACVRGVNTFPKRIYYTCNPDGVGMAYIKRIFIDRKFEEGEDPNDYSFIQSLLTDNEALMKSDPSYMKYLESLPHKLKQAWLSGRWDVFEGSFFEEFRETPDPMKCFDAGISVEKAMEEHRWTHVIKPFNPPKHWTCLRSFDFGYSRPFSVAWTFFDESGCAYRAIELYGCTKTPNEGLKWTPDEIFSEVARIEAEHPWLKGRRIEGVADPAIWEKSHGISVADTAEEHRVYFEKGDNSRINGWMQIHERMKFDENGYAMLYFFDTCKAIIRCMPLMMYDEHKVEDLDTSLEDHCLDDLRYGMMRYQILPRIIEDKNIPLIDPLNQFNHLPTNRFNNAIIRRN